MLPKLTDKDAQKIKEIDQSVANKLKFEWLDVLVQISKGTEQCDVRIGDCFEKVSLAGQAHCKVCDKVTNYGSRGVVSLKEHIKSTKHVKMHFESRKCYKVCKITRSVCITDFEMEYYNIYNTIFYTVKFRPFVIVLIFIFAG